ncbi:metal-sulfur cluster assembly factor [Anaeromyxobacter dehalogenans]|uniref:MIP18 family-like domain-containing protein n=1 Tax=Anaeromyxobacter dehalogenans (strain 2CP-C) TaxID=290397 RepID=Q2IMS1_ANADE|nr:metal-sulfur cluster assembly factor [Anaeromyxobacter dehalogenans]ABC80103.1 protein of unknown function DUF59 [Anaeromyxobacter dehalogenans 2CP-C]
MPFRPNARSRASRALEWTFAALLLGASAAILVAAGVSRADAHYQWTRPAGDPARGAVTPAAVWERLRTVLDPELGIDVVDLGLVYDVTVPRDGRVAVVMTLTSAGCPFSKQMIEDVRRAIFQHPAVREVALTVTRDPPWSWDRVSLEARKRIVEGSHAGAHR